jgi:gliding motility-associated-like protein
MTGETADEMKYLRVIATGAILMGILGTGMVRGQYFANPSFEGPPGIGSCPPSWEPLDMYSTPDTEPLPCDPFTASHGNTYLTLVTRGTGRQFEGTSENVITGLSEPLQPGQFYRLTIDLASRDDLGHFSWEDGFVAYTSTAVLKVFECTGPIHRGALLARTGAVTNQSWSTFDLILHPFDACDFLLLEVAQLYDDTGSANLLLDHIRLEKIDEPPLEYGELEVPNLFTPNGDGTNDSFMIRGLAPGSYLSVFDRSGREVFTSDDYKHDWYGKDREGVDLPEGTYWYVLFPSGEDRVMKGFIYLKRE